VTGAPTFTLDFRARTYHDFMTLVAPSGVTLSSEPLDPAAPVRYYLLRATPGRQLTLTVRPNAPTLDARIQTLTRDEAVDRTFDGGLAGANEVAQFPQTAAGWTAFAVSSAVPLVGGVTFDLTVVVAP